MNARLRRTPSANPRARIAIVLGAIFASAALGYFWRQALGWPLLPMRITARRIRYRLTLALANHLATNQVVGSTIQPDSMRVNSPATAGSTCEK